MTTEQIFNNLMKLTSTHEAFSWKDAESPGGGKFRIFSYRLASYTDFLEPSALECRGSLFRLDDNGNYAGCAARTPIKFFNAYENPFTMFDKSTLSSEIAVAMDKLDGSIISTYMDADYKVRTKSHASLYSEHAINSTAILHRDKDFYEEVYQAEILGYTVNMEYTSPQYRIVLPYFSDNLTVLNVRHRESGEMLVGETLKDAFPGLYKRSVSAKFGNIDSTFPMKETLLESVNAVREMQDIEGYILILKDGRICKVKTNWYSALHFTKDGINVDSRLFTTVLEGASDDLRQMFSTDIMAIKKIEKMEQLVFYWYNKLVDTVETFYAENKHLDAKSYALKVQSTLPKELNTQGLAFKLYSSQDVDYKATMLKYMKVILKDFEL